MNRSIVILPAFVLVALALVVLYALLGFRGPEVVLREARVALDRDQFERSIRLLDAAETAVLNSNPELLEQTLRMRVVAYSGLGLREQALEDIRTLFEVLGIRDRDLMCIRVHTLNELAAELDDGAALRRAWDLAETWLARHPDDALMLAEAGVTKDLEAKQMFAKWTATTNSQSPPNTQQRLRKLMNTAIYSTAIPRVRESQILMLTESVERFITGSTQDTIDNVARMRDLALQGREFFLRSLAVGGMVPIAYEGLAAQLRAAGDDDTLLMIAHACLDRASPANGLVAAVDIADVHLRHGRLTAAVRIIERVLPLGTLRQKFLDAQLNHHVMRLIVCRTLAVLALNDRDQARHLLGDFLALQNRDDQKVIHALQTAPLRDFIAGMLLEDAGQQRARLVNFVYSNEMRNFGWNRTNLLQAAYRRLSQVCQAGERRLILERWMDAVPDSVAPVHDLARIHTLNGSAELAVSMLEHAMRTLPKKDTTLELLVAAQMTLFQGDLDESIQRAASLAVSVPDEIGPYPALTLAAARRALELNRFRVALGCCERARTRYSDTRIPIYLKAEILLAMHQPKQAGRVMQHLLEEDPSDRKALVLLMRARVENGESTADLRFEALLRSTPDLESTRYLAQKWLERGQYQRVLELTKQATEQFKVDLELQVLATRALMMDPDAGRRRILTMLRAVYYLSRTTDDSAREQRLTLWALAQYILKNPENASYNVRAAMLDKFLEDNQSAEDLVELATGLVATGETELGFRSYLDLVSETRYAVFREGKHFVAAGRLALQLGNRPKASSLLKQALAFDGGDAAELDLALLEMLDGQKPQFTTPPKIDSIRACCVAPDRKAAVEFLTLRLTSNPDDLAAQCLLAVFEPNDGLSPRVRSLANVAGEELVFLIALLQDKAFAEDALHKLLVLTKKYPDDHVLAVLKARAHANAEEYAEVRPSLDRAREALLEDTVLTAEALDILASSDSPLVRNSKIMDYLLGRVLAKGSNMSPALMATLVRHNAAVLDVPGMREDILPIVAAFWLRHTKLSGAGVREARILIDAGDLGSALHLLTNLEPFQPESERSAFLELYFSTMQKFAPDAEPFVVNGMALAAIKVLKHECVHGAPLHFAMSVLDAEIERLAGTEQGEESRQRMLNLESQYLLKHIAYFQAGHDPNVENLAKTLSRYGRREGFERGLEKVDEILRKDPSLLPVWLLRADWLVQLNRVEDAVTSLEWLPRYLQDPIIVDALIQLMGRSGILVRMGAGLLKHEGLVTASRLSLGIVQLRLGSYVPAAQVMELAKPRENGDHIYYRAMALFAIGMQDTTDLARRLLIMLVEEYPESSYADSARTVGRMFSSDLGR